MRGKVRKTAHASPFLSFDIAGKSEPNRYPNPMRLSFLALLIVVCSAPDLGGQIPVLLYPFDEGPGAASTQNGGIGGLSQGILNGHDLSGTGANATSALAGQGGVPPAPQYVDTGWTVDLPLGFTVTFAIDSSNHQNPGNPFGYVFGSPSAGGLRCFTAGSGGALNATLRGGGLADVQIPEGSGLLGWRHVAVTYDHVAGMSSIYLGGTLISQVPQPTGLVFSGTSPDFWIGGYQNAPNSSLQQGQALDDFGFYDHVLSLQEIVQLAQAAGAATPPNYQINQPAARLLIDGLEGTAFAPAIVFRPAGTLHTFSMESTQVGFPFELAFVIPALVPRNASNFFPISQQVINVDVTAPSTSYWNGLLSGTPGTPLSMPYPGNLSFPFSLATSLSLTTQGVWLDPSNPDLIALSQPIRLVNPVCMTFETMDSLLLGTGNLPTGWTDGGGTSQWAAASGPTPTSATGPQGDHTSGTGTYLYCETSSPNQAATFIVDIGTYSVTSGAGVQFWYHAFGQDVGTLTLEQESTVTPGMWIVRWTIPTPLADQWRMATVSLGISNPHLRFRYQAGGGFLGDIAIDDVAICN